MESTSQEGDGGMYLDVAKHLHRNVKDGLVLSESTTNRGTFLHFK